jgi:hypothetical protein
MRKIIFVLAAVLCVSAAMRMPASAKFIPAGSYQDTCDTIQISGSTLYARCQDISGNWHQASTDMSACPSRTFANNDGNLVCGRGGWGIARQLPPGSWRSSCINASENNGMLYAQCDTPSGNWNSTSVSMSNCPSGIVDNSNGTLVCRGGYSGYNQYNQWNGGNGSNGSTGYLPGGSWQKSCRNSYVQGNVLYAQCSNGYGGWNQSSIDFGRYPNAQIANDHGNLVFANGPIYRNLQ